MIDYGAIEDQIAARLTEKLTGVPNIKITVLEENESDFKAPVFKRKITIAFSGEDADPNEGMNAMHSEVSATFSVMVESRLLRGENGLYQLGELVKKYLVGFQPDNASVLTYSGQKFVDNEKDTFQHVIDFKTVIFRVEDIEEETGPPFDYLTIEQDY